MSSIHHCMQRNHEIHFVAHGIKVTDIVVIPIGLRGLISRCALGSKILLKHFGPYQICQIPQFSSNRLRVSVESTNQSNDFSADKFELFVKKVAGFLDAARNRKILAPELSYEERPDLDLRLVARSLLGLGILKIRIRDSRTIILNCNQSQASATEREAIRTVESLEEMTKISHAEGAFMMSKAESRRVKIGDRIKIDEQKNAHRIRRATARGMIKAVDPHLSVNDLFNPVTPLASDRI